MKPRSYLTATGMALLLTVFEALAQFGNPVNGTLQDGISANYIQGSAFSTATNQMVDTIYCKIGASLGRYKCAIYTSGQRFVVGSVEVSSPVSDGWRAFPLTSPVTLTNGSYHLVAWSDNAASTIFYVSGGNSMFWHGATYAATWPATINFTAANSVQYNYCIYATNAAGVVLPPQPPAAPANLRIVSATVVP